MTASRTTCPDCSTPLQPVKLIDATEPGRRVELRYAPQDAPLRLFLGIKPEGSVYGRLCGECGRILLYAVPMES